MKIRTCFSGLAMAAGLATAPASAAVTYEFTGSIGSFTYITADYVTSDRSVPVAQLSSCSTIQDACAGAFFDVDYVDRGTSSSLQFFNRGPSSSGTYFYYFTLGAFAQNGAYATTGSNPGTLTVSGFAGPINAAVPEPGTWALMILGFGAVGAGMRRKRTMLVYA